MPRRRKPLVEAWWAVRWLEALSGGAPEWEARLARGRAISREGRVRALVAEAGHAAAQVQGQRVAPYRVDLRFATFDDATWRRAAALMARHAGLAAGLLAGDLPRAVDDLFLSLGRSLFPTPEERLAIGCACREPARPCQHAVALLYVLATRIEKDPFVLFTLRGRTRDELVAALRAERTLLARDAHGAPEVSGAPTLADELAAEVGRFWAAGAPAAEPVASEEPLPALKRLGYPPAALGGAELRRELAEAYRILTEHAGRVAGS